MNIEQAFRRALRAFREDLRLHVIAISTLVVAFLCLGASLWISANLDRIASRMGATSRVTVFLSPDADAAQVERLRGELERQSLIARVEFWDGARSRTELVGAAEDPNLMAIPADYFPRTLEVYLRGHRLSNALSLASRLRQVPAVEDVETYEGWLGSLTGAVNAGRTVAWVFTIVGLFSAVLLIGNTIRMSISGRREEIEVLKLCGATDRFVRTPFLVEGAAQGLLASTLAVITLALGYWFTSNAVGPVVTQITGQTLTFLSPGIIVMVLCSGLVLGMIGSAMSVRRYLAL